MNARRLAAALIVGAFAGVPTAAGANAPIFNCTYHPEWPVRKYDCTGAGTDYGLYGCEVHWTDDDADNDWTDSNSRVITIRCVGLSGVSACHEIVFNTTWQCTGIVSTTGSGIACTVQTWTDDDSDPHYDSGAVWLSRTLCV